MPESMLESAHLASSRLLAGRGRPDVEAEADAVVEAAMDANADADVRDRREEVQGARNGAETLPACHNNHVTFR